MLLEQRVGSEIGGVTTGGKNDGSVLGVLEASARPAMNTLASSRLAHFLAVFLVLDTQYGVALLDQLADFCLLQNLDSIRLRLGQILKLEYQL